VEYSLHYAGEKFALPAEEAQKVKVAIAAAAKGAGTVVTLEYLRRDAGVTTLSFLFSPGVPMYLKESDPPAKPATPLNGDAEVAPEDRPF
jgi:hypothetical protein